MQLISNDRKFFKTSELIEMGYSHYKIKALAESGIIKKINKSTYENLGYAGEENDFFTVDAYVPEGVICLMSAARFYELTNYLPGVVDVAIDRKKKVSTLPDWPELKIYYFDSTRMELGEKEIKEGNNKFRIFDIEKTVVDIVYYRNKVGIEETAEILKNYLKHSDRKIDRLYSYAKRLRCEQTLRTYLEVLI